VQAHYVPEASVNVLPSRERGRVTRARKRPMSSLLYTYADLKNIFSSQLAADLGVAAASIANMVSALNAFMAEQGLTDSSVIGPTLRVSFYKARDKHLEQLRADGRPAAYVSNRKVLLSKWRSALLESDRRLSAARSEPSPFQVALKELVAQRGTIKGTARNARIPLATLRRWLEGGVPNGRTLGLVAGLERFYALPAGTLTDLLPFRLRMPAETKTEPEVRIEYRERHKVLSAVPYALHDPSEALRAEWRELVQFKTEFGQYRRWKDGVAQVLQRQKSGRWKCTNEYVDEERARNWYAFHEGAFVPTAGITWQFVAQFLGWLRLSTSEGGPGLPADQVHTLAHLANGRYVERHLAWKIKRSGGTVHGGITSFLKLVKSLCNPQTGYITQSWSVLAGGVNIPSQEQWRALCADTYEAVRAKARDYADVAKRNRDPFAPIRAILNLPNPLEGVVDAIKRMEANRPAPGGVAEALWARDRLLMQLLASNPLRKKNLQLLTFRADGTGHLRKEDGVWRICISREEFKNERGAAKDRPYRMQVREELWADIERYLAAYRPLLADAENPYLLVGGKSRTEPWRNLARHFAVLTKRYFVRCPGVGPQSMRHIVATSILKLRPNDWATAAWALHDREETVKENYAHLRSDDAVRWLDPVLAGPFSRL
jgi:hypothetical protein